MMTKRILLIDDEDDIREVAQMSLEFILNWQVITAQSGQEGILKASQELPDAILLDVMMPELDGLMTFHKLQINPKTKHIPVILLTAQVQAEEHRKFVLSGVSGVITKPFEPLSLGALVEKILDWA
ncbi:response regulator [Limnoraphis robusta Tam1]|uniref:response regulator n=1 Tax=Limnoraphis robusta TaxID=1118279 RepID=UPI002B20178F|nr:response regulator [Limnoraphis robusta]MEA5496420.1 response regulator [Limnoraphis robusta BA-68 BA1]MEA5539505.1 response regulator [Limnoraphis robusta Tam1]